MLIKSRRTFKLLALHRNTSGGDRIRFRLGRSGAGGGAETNNPASTQKPAPAIVSFAWLDKLEVDALKDRAR